MVKKGCVVYDWIFFLWMSEMSVVHTDEQREKNNNNKKKVINSNFFFLWSSSPSRMSWTWPSYIQKHYVVFLSFLSRVWSDCHYTPLYPLFSLENKRDYLAWVKLKMSYLVHYDVLKGEFRRCVSCSFFWVCWKEKSIVDAKRSCS